MNARENNTPYHLLYPIIKFKQERMWAWNPNIEGHAAIDAVLNNFNIVVKLEEKHPVLV